MDNFIVAKIVGILKILSLQPTGLQTLIIFLPNKFVKLIISSIMKNIETHQTLKAQHIFDHVPWYENHSKHDWFVTSGTIRKTTV